MIDVLRASTPWIVLDVPHVWTALDAAHAVGADEVVVVAAPDLANLRNAKNMIDNIKSARPHDHPPRLVLNGVGMPKRPEIAVADFAKTVETRADRGHPARRQAVRRRRPTTAR